MEFFKDNMEPKDDDQIFITNYQIDVDIFRVTITSICLLKSLTQCYSLSVDGTYKLNILKYPLIVIGVVDQRKKFHPVLFMISNIETMNDYIYGFTEIISKFTFYFGREPVISNIISDGSRTIAGACEKVFGSSVRRRTCYFHMKKNVDVYLKKVDDEDIRKQLENDIYSIHLASSDDLFNLSISLFLLKYENSTRQVNAVIEYIKANWLGEFRYWYEGACRHAPSTNNGIESFNRKIKDTGTMRTQLPLMQFINRMFSFLHFISINSRIGLEYEIGTSPIVTNSLWVQSIKFYHKIKNQIIDSQTPLIFNCNTLKFTEEPISLVTFEEYKRFTFNYIILEIEGTTAFCSCKFNQKDYICSHSLGLLIKLGYIIPPISLELYTVPESRSVGRPAHVSSALEMDN